MLYVTWTHSEILGLCDIYSTTLAVHGVQFNIEQQRKGQKDGRQLHSQTIVGNVLVGQYQQPGTIAPLLCTHYTGITTAIAGKNRMKLLII